MRKILVFVLLVVPMTAIAASSVRMLGSNNSASPAQKITPTKSTTSVGTVTASRVGTLRAAPKAGGTVGAISGSNSRFPVITTTRPYNIVASPKTENNVVADSGADTEAIIQDIENNYYTKSYIDNNYYSKTEITNVITEALDDAIEDDPRFDAIRTVNPYEHRGNPPEGYVYIWIEQ